MKKTPLYFCAFICAFILNAQNTMYIMKDNVVIGQHNISTEVDSIIFYTPEPQGPVAVSSISFANNQATIFSGQTLNLLQLLTISPTNASNKTITWTSNNSSIVSVNASTGVATAGTTAGSAIITAKTNDGSNLTATITITVSLSAPKPYVTGKIPNAKYIGRWTTTGTYDTSYYLGAMIKVRFTGTTAKIQLEGGKGWDSYPLYSIDGGPLQKMLPYPGWGQTEFNLTPTPLADTTHSLVIIGNDSSAYSESNNLFTAQLVLDPGKQTLAPILSNKHIEFIGDSITAGWGLQERIVSNYGWLIGEELGLEHSHIASSGISLGGMATDYFKTGSDVATAWNFSATYQPDLVFINLGQNGGVSQAAYTTFLQNIRAKAPNAWILGMIPFNNTTANANRAAITNAINSMNDAKIKVVDGSGLLINGTANDYLDAVELHPNEAGNRKAADYLKPIIANYLGL